jgi:hypothetical protein
MSRYPYERCMTPAAREEPGVKASEKAETKI